MIKQVIRRLLVGFGLLISMVAGAEEPDWSEYAAALNAHVSSGIKNGTRLATVDYRALKESTVILRLANRIEGFDVNRLADDRERLAFYINAYNILAIKMVIDNEPLDSIKDAGSLFTSVWKTPAGVIAGKTVSLDEIEHKILRPMGEPRIHMAIVCASVSCPDLRNEPYAADKLDDQLDSQTIGFLTNGAKGLRQAGQTIHISKIFRWFEEDFELTGGVEMFVRRYRQDLSRDLEFEADIPYDWSLNGDV